MTTRSDLSQPDLSQPDLRQPDLRQIVLGRGAHATREDGLCVMECVAFVAGLPHSDTPECTDPVLARVVTQLNDRWSAADRQTLLQLVPLLVGTRGDPALSQRRAFFIVDAVLRSLLPAFLRELPVKPQPDLAAKLEALSPIVDQDSALLARSLAHQWSHTTFAALTYVAPECGYTDADAVIDAVTAAYKAATAHASAVIAADYAYAANAAAPWAALRDRTRDRMLQILREAIALGAAEAPT